MKNVKSVRQLGKIIFEGSYELKCQDTDRMVAIIQPISDSEVSIFLDDGTQQIMRVDVLDEFFEIVQSKVGNAQVVKL